VPGQFQRGLEAYTGVGAGHQDRTAMLARHISGSPPSGHDGSPITRQTRLILASPHAHARTGRIAAALRHRRNRAAASNASRSYGVHRSPAICTAVPRQNEIRTAIHNGGSRVKGSRTLVTKRDLPGRGGRNNRIPAISPGS
jgi:hypothetical protein